MMSQSMKFLQICQWLNFYASTSASVNDKEKSLNTLYIIKQYKEHAVLIQYIWSMKSESEYKVLADFITSEDFRKVRNMMILLSKQKHEIYSVNILIYQLSDNFITATDSFAVILEQFHDNLSHFLKLKLNQITDSEFSEDSTADLFKLDSSWAARESQDQLTDADINLTDD